MNYLAHAFLSCDNAEMLIGGLLGDFVKGTPGEQYSPIVRESILLHRQIDRYTDDHELVRASRALIHPRRRRFAGIMIDVFHDHFLAKAWPHHSSVPLDQFTRDFYRILELAQQDLPQRLQRMLPFMIRDNWLCSYRELWAVEAALNGIARRFKRPTTLPEGMQDLEYHYTQLNSYFNQFFPQLVRHVEDLKMANPVLNCCSKDTCTSYAI